MQNPTHIRQLADQRMQSAAILSQNGQHDDAFYLAGYVVELELKARICELLDCPNLFDEDPANKIKEEGFNEVRRVFKTHNLKLLLRLSGLKTTFDNAKAMNQTLMKANSLLFEQWSEHCRYQPVGHCQPKDMRDILGALNDPSNGLIQWIRNN